MFCFLDANSSNPVKSAIYTYIGITNIYILNQPVNYQFQSGDQSFICHPVTDKEIAFSVHISTLLVTRMWVILNENILNANLYSGNADRSHYYYHINPKIGKDDSEEIVMEHSGIYVQRIRKLCKARGIAINKLAVKRDVKQSTPDNIVRGLTKNLKVKTLHKIALAFYTTLALLLDFG